MTMGNKLKKLFDRYRTHQGLPTYPKGNQIKRSSELQGKMKGMRKVFGIRSENNKANFVHKSLVHINFSDVIYAFLSSA